MIKLSKITWDFEETEFEDCSHAEAVEIAVLPVSLKIKECDLESDACEDEIKDYLSENFGFSVKEIEVDC